MRLPELGSVAIHVSRDRRINDTAHRVFVALRNETRAHSVTNDHVAALLELADTLATAIVDGTGGDISETHVVARACAVLDAQCAATAHLHSAITRVRDNVGDLLR